MADQQDGVEETPKTEDTQAAVAGENLEQQAAEQAGQQQVRVRIDERDLNTSYANAFRTHARAEEVILDFGLNSVNQATAQQANPEITFNIDQRVIMNYYSAKRLAITLGQLIRQHEDNFGELELDIAKRQKGQA